MLAWLASFLTAPIINGFLNAYQKKLDSANQAGMQAVEVTRAALLAEVEARKSAQAVIIAEQGRWYTAVPRVMVEFSFASFVFKCIVWDNLLGLGTTDPLGGQVAEWGGWLMTMWFGGATVTATAGAIARVFKR